MTPTTDRCPVCGGEALDDRGPAPDHVQGRSFRLKRCRTCTVTFVHPPLPDDELASYYPDAFYGGLTGEEVSSRIQRLFLSRRVARLRRWGLRRGRLLDVGAGDGQFLLAAQHAGFSVAGSEPSTAGRTRAAARGLDVADAPDAFRGQHFDVITLWHVLEHVADAGALLDALSDLLAPGGALVLAVPNASSVEARVFGGAWFHQDVPRHQLQLTPESLRMLLSRHGWSIAERSSFSIEYDPFGLVQSLWNRLTPRAHNGLYRVLKGNEPLRSLPAGARAPTALALATLPWTAGAALAADAALAPLARTGTMTVLARR